MDPKDPEDLNDPAPFPGEPANFDPFPPRGREMSARAGTPPDENGADARNDWILAADPHDLPTRESRLRTLGRYAFPPEPALDEEGEAARDRRWTSRVVMVAGVFLLVFNSVSITNWARQQQPGWIESTVQQLGEVWSDRIALLGADQPRQGLRDAYEAATEARFPGQEKATPAA